MTEKGKGEEKERAMEEGEIMLEEETMGITIRPTKTLAIMGHLDSKLEVAITMQEVKEAQDITIKVQVITTRASKVDIKAKDAMAKHSNNNRTVTSLKVIRGARKHT